MFRLENPAGQGWGIIAPGYPDIDYNNLRSVPLEEEGRGDMNQVFDPRTGFIEFLHFNGDGHCITVSIFQGDNQLLTTTTFVPGPKF